MAENRRINEELARERSMRQNRDYDVSVYNRLYNWGLDLVPAYYTYVQRRRLDNALKELIKDNLLMQMPEYKLEELIKASISETSTASETPAVPKTKMQRKKTPNRKTSKKKTPKRKTTKKKTPTRKTSKRK
jgi:hypothetical protein